MYLQLLFQALKRKPTIAAAPTTAKHARTTAAAAPVLPKSLPSGSALPATPVCTADGKVNCLLGQITLPSLTSQMLVTSLTLMLIYATPEQGVQTLTLLTHTRFSVQYFLLLISCVQTRNKHKAIETGILL